MASRLLGLAGLVLALAWRLAAAGPEAAPENLIYNGAFELGPTPDGAPKGWAAAGDANVRQRLTLEPAEGGGHCARLVCEQIGREGPSSHAMICQTGRAAVRKDRWYQLSFRARAAGLASAVSVALNCTRPWQNAGLDDIFMPGPDWAPFTFVFQARLGLMQGSSRLQFWHRSTGELWIDDVVLVETTDPQQWLPQLSTTGVKNLIPNSSFECGPAGWGGWHSEPGGWGNDLCRLEGQIDWAGGAHGSNCLRIDLAPSTVPVFWFDYFDAVRRPARQIMAAHHGWVRALPGAPYTFSVYLRADVEGVIALISVVQSRGRPLTRQVKTGVQWKRHEFTFAPTDPFFYAAAGLDLDLCKRDEAILWIDAVQLEQGPAATAYEPRQPVESFLECASPGGVSPHPGAGLPLTLRAWNSTPDPQTLRGRLEVSDFWDQEAVSRELALVIPGQGAAALPLPGTLAGRRGFFRASWNAGGTSNALRCALIDPPLGTNSPLGMNHAYPWDFLMTQARLAGLVWWRDWSAKWHVVEPQRGQFNFRDADLQIERLLGLQCRPVVLLPFPSSFWAASPRPGAVVEPGNALGARAALAEAPANTEDFGRYAGAVAARYRNRAGVYQVLNEPLYTSYALPAARGYTMDHYLALLEKAWRALKTTDPACQVIGGPGAGPASSHTRQFIERDGLQFADILDLHIYAPPGAAEAQEPVFAELEELMRAHGGPKPAWITEFGCYADDDPPCEPQTVGDSSMNRCNWRNERAASEFIVKFSAVAFGRGVRKILFHAGTSGPINGLDGGGVFFEHGGAPRKMFAAAAVLNHLLGVPENCVARIDESGFHARVFQTGARHTAVVWGGSGPARPLRLEAGVSAADVMGNPLTGPEIRPGGSPLYLWSADTGALRRALGAAQP